MKSIHRKSVEIEKEFEAPENLTFEWQESRRSFSVWYISDDYSSYKYIILGTGQNNNDIKRIISTICIDGYHVFHLCLI